MNELLLLLENLSSNTNQRKTFFSCKLWNEVKLGDTSTTCFFKRVPICLQCGQHTARTKDYEHRSSLPPTNSYIYNHYKLINSFHINFFDHLNKVKKKKMENAHKFCHASTCCTSDFLEASIMSRPPIQLFVKIFGL